MLILERKVSLGVMTTQSEQFEHTDAGLSVLIPSTNSGDK